MVLVSICHNFFCIHSLISEVHHFMWDFSYSSSVFPATSLGLTILGEIFLLLRSQLGLWGSPSWVRLFFFCVPSNVSGVHHFGWDFSSFSLFPVISLGFITLGEIFFLLLLHSSAISLGSTIIGETFLLLRSQLDLCGSLFWVRFFFFFFPAPR